MTYKLINVIKSLTFIGGVAISRTKWTYVSLGAYAFEKGMNTSVLPQIKSK